MVEIPRSWKRFGLILPRSAQGPASEVIGDPCIVWDEELQGWRMFLFCQPPGHGQAICLNQNDVGPGQWQFTGPLTFSNPEALLGGTTHKPFVVMDSQQMNHAAVIAGHYCLVTISYLNGHKVVQRAWADRLAGPWTLESEVFIGPGNEDEFDGKHVDAVSAYYFADRQEIIYFYMGYPLQAQQREGSRFGSAQAVATQRIGEPHIHKRGIILAPSAEHGHWAGGWVGGLQLFRGKTHHWLALINASPTAPVPTDTAISREEPPPSLGGFAYCDEEWPVHGWHWCPDPIEWIEDVPEQAVASGEGTNLWRHHILALPQGGLALFYNSGSYGQEQIYLRLSD